MNPISERMLSHFTFSHLPEHLQSISETLCYAAFVLAEKLDSFDPIAVEEVTIGLRKLLEAKDCFMRAGVILHKSSQQWHSKVMERARCVDRGMEGETLGV